MIQLCAKMGRAVPIFLTLTYGKDWPSDPAEWKKHLANFNKRLFRLNPELSDIWRLEPQKRGAPHFHLLIYKSDGKKPFVCKDWIARAWSSVLGEYSNADHLKAGTRVESLKSSRGAAFYVAKYCAKLPEDDDFPEEWGRAGRLWGSGNKSKLPMAKQHEMILHSALEQKATLFTMHDAFKRAFLAKAAKKHESEGVDSQHALHLAIEDYKHAEMENPHFGNTGTFYGDATSFIKLLSSKIGHLECILSQHEGREPDSTVLDRLAASF